MLSLSTSKECKTKSKAPLSQNKTKLSLKTYNKNNSSNNNNNGGGSSGSKGEDLSA
jgi:hypothetical protein